MERCLAKTLKSRLRERCWNSPQKGSKFCHLHQGPQPPSPPPVRRRARTPPPARRAPLEVAGQKRARTPPARRSSPQTSALTSPSSPSKGPKVPFVSPSRKITFDLLRGGRDYEIFENKGKTHYYLVPGTRSFPEFERPTDHIINGETKKAIVIDKDSREQVRVFRRYLWS